MSTTDPRRELGAAGEAFAAAHYERLGYAVLARNHRTRHGELDLVVSDGREIVFCEVKTRRRGSGHPWDSLHPRKQEQVRRMALAWLAEAKERPYGALLRFDAVGVVVDRDGALVSLDHLAGAF